MEPLVLIAVPRSSPSYTKTEESKQRARALRRSTPTIEPPRPTDRPDAHDRENREHLGLIPDARPNEQARSPSAVPSNPRCVDPACFIVLDPFAFLARPKYYKSGRPD
ncbi:hypothetical protein LZ32DRAFT_143271 [Colletotrichum eremochloae]|nr:hypothetical protein LY78DRAFT_146769 [Colletotrichum sublineola]KAK2019540.1 hypothetical protein LZ32DRAFT_143271 [Colletotrichum eremochloae]